MWPRQHRVARGQGKTRANEHTAVAPSTPETNSQVLEGRVASSSYEGLGRSNGRASSGGAGNSILQNACTAAFRSTGHRQARIEFPTGVAVPPQYSCIVLPYSYATTPSCSNARQLCSILPTASPWLGLESTRGRGCRRVSE